MEEGHTRYLGAHSSIARTSTSAKDESKGKKTREGHKGQDIVHTKAKGVQTKAKGANIKGTPLSSLG